MDEFTAAVAKGMRSQRAARQWSQAELAVRLGWTQSAVSAAEQERRGLRIDQVFAIAEVFDIPVISLFRDAPADVRRRLLGARLTDRIEL